MMEIYGSEQTMVAEIFGDQGLIVLALIHEHHP